jgi:hypothetical protein
MTKMASVRETFRPNQSTISTKIMAKALTNNEKLFAIGYQGIDVATWIDIKKHWVSEICT